MRSPDEIAAARSEWLDELEARVGRFAYGRDLSERYAHELHAWLAERHGARLDVLRDYRSKTGQVQAREACRRLLADARDEVYGECFPWHSPHEDHHHAWWRASAACPACGAPTFRRYVRAYEHGRAGLWTWCSTCFAYEHASGSVPADRVPSPVLDAVPTSVLGHSPEMLERALRLSAPQRVRPPTHP
jgi:hypothetical protein